MEPISTQVNLLEAKPIGMWFVLFYLDKTGQKQFIEVSEAEYDAGIASGTYIGGGHLTKFDTPSGLLEDGYFFQDGPSQVVKIAGKAIDPLPSSVQVVGGLLDISSLNLQNDV